MSDSLRFDRERMQFVFEDILLNKIIRNHLLSENMHHLIMLPLLIIHAQDHGILRDIFFGTRQLRAKKKLSNSWQWAKPFTPCAARTIIFKLFNSLFHWVYLVFSKVCFLLYCRIVCRALSVGRMKRRQMLCCDTARSRHSRRSACLRSHVLRAYCNCESKEANSITRFGRGPNKKHLLALLGPFWVILLDLWGRY